MSKNFGNFTDPNELMDRYSADALRFLLLSSPVLNAEDFSLQDKDVGDVARKLSMVWNMYDFFTLYADVDNWDSGLKEGELPPDPSLEMTSALDQWIISRVHQLTQEVDGHMQRYDLPNALKPILPFLDDASNWYVRRSRKRFWKSQNDVDKANAYRTLHYVLVQLSLILAPVTPFLAEELYRKLTGGESVHLLDWPLTGHVNELVIRQMDATREAITIGLAERAEAGIRVRQPLELVVVSDVFEPGQPEDSYADYLEIIAEELNVKVVEINNSTEQNRDEIGVVKVKLDINVTPELKREGLMREVVRNVQQARKQAGLEVDDRINLALETSSEELTTVLKDNFLTGVIKQETLAQKLNESSVEGFETTVKVEGAELTIRLAKA